MGQGAGANQMGGNRGGAGGFQAGAPKPLVMVGLNRPTGLDEHSAIGESIMTSKLANR